MAKHNDVGKIGEDIAEKFLKSRGLSVINRNWRKPYGEIDIVAREKKLTRFIEVKTVSYETSIRPEENVHPQKLRKLSRVIESYIVSHETDDWVFDVICVYVDIKTKSAKIKWLKDIILE